MKYKFIAAAATAVLLFNTFAMATGDDRRSKDKTRAARLVSMLPASDGVAVIDAKRLLDTALPTLLTSNPPLLSGITSQLAQVNTRTGIDLRAFDQIAVGVTVKAGLTNDIDIDVVAIATGSVDTTALLAAAKAASAGAHHEETLNGRSILIFQTRPLPQLDSNANPAGSVYEKLAKIGTQQIAMSVIDSRSVAVGSLARVRETVSGRTHVAAELSDLLPAKAATLNFAVRNGGLLSAMLPIDNDELGKKIGSIQALSGSADITSAGLSISAVARTPTAAEALSLKDFLEVLRDLGGVVYGQSKNADKQLYGRLIRSVKLGSRSNTVTLDVTVPQADVDLLVKKLK